MSISILYHSFGIRGSYKYKKTEYTKDITFEIENKELSCPDCGSKNVIRRGSKCRMFRTLPIGKKLVYIKLSIKRVECKECGIIKQVKLDFAEAKKTYTRAFENYALDLLEHMTIQAVSKHLQISWDIIKDIQKRNLKKEFEKPRLKDLKLIAIDEIYVGKKDKYLTIVLDLDSGRVVFVGEGKGSDALLPFWKRLNYSGACIEAVAMDMSPAYKKAVEYHLPEAKIVFDHFHVVKLFNEKLSNYRTSLANKVEEEEKKKVLKGTRWLLLKNPNNLDKKKRI